MLTLHHLEQSRSFRILWALEELGAEYQVKFYKRLPNFSGPPELKKVHPLGKAPILTDGELNIAESAVILEYLQENFDAAGQFAPQTAAERQQYRYWMHYAEGSLMPLLVMYLVMSLVPKQVPWLVKPIAKKVSDGVQQQFVGKRLPDHIQYLETYLGEHDYFAGQFSFADIQMSFPLIALKERTGGGYPNIQAFVQRISSRPAFQRAQQKEQALNR
ncbi:glutathione S-transferase family protein [Acinetobacter sp. ANC 3813]|uniref:glutathione S-transferase family protein n=1 Tax=Acinetobacter sp. ANC 3813 TaxID=1977873 RepID=UPI000A3332C2|nr:glutathione S-transferase [Acinetobacter sp. ANC 3813]OTG88614.1 glutathione S-transferase [Acinetobacter sp. ANC 3813]